MMKKLSVCSVAVVLLLLSGCKIPDAMYMSTGVELSDKIKSEKLSVAVFPTVDWSELEGCCIGYLTYGLGGAFYRKEAFTDAEMLFTNELTRSLWKKNRMVVVKKEEILRAFENVTISRRDMFPKNDVITILDIPAPIKSKDDVGMGDSPDYEKIFAIGDAIGCDLILISRITKNTQTPVISMNPIGAYPPYTTIVGVGSAIVQSAVIKEKKVYVAIDMMVLDVKNREVLTFGGFNKMNQVSKSNIPSALEDVNAAVTFYMPMPDDEDLIKDWLAEAGSYVANMVVNYAISGLVGLEIGLRFNFDYDYADDTWRMYPDDYFNTNYEFNDAEFKKLYK
jgi:hypothetical protein